MTSVTDLREVVDVVVGVDTHVETHTADAVCARTGAVLGELTVPTAAAGYRQLVGFADEHGALRVWAIKGTGGHGAGLTRLLTDSDEVVTELDRPVRAARRHGAESDPLDAVRAAREALAHPHLGGPRRAGDRQHCRCCWFRKAMSVLSSMPILAQPAAKGYLGEIWGAEDERMPRRSSARSLTPTQRSTRRRRQGPR